MLILSNLSTLLKICRLSLFNRSCVSLRSISNLRRTSGRPSYSLNHKNTFGRPEGNTKTNGWRVGGGIFLLFGTLLHFLPGHRPPWHAAACTRTKTPQLHSRRQTATKNSEFCFFNVKFVTVFRFLSKRAFVRSEMKIAGVLKNGCGDLAVPRSSFAHSRFERVDASAR